MKRKRMLKLIIPISLVVVLAIAVPMMSGCRAPAPAEELEPIKIGVPVSLTGYAAADGIEAKQGAIMAAEEINAAGGLLGRPLEIVVTDTKEYEADVIRSGAEELMAAGVDLVVTMYILGTLDVHVYGKYDVPYMHADTDYVATIACVDNLPEYSNVLAIDPWERNYGPSAAVNMIDIIPVEWDYQHPNKKVAILTSDWSYAKGIAETFREELAKRGWTVVHDSIHAAGTTEYGVELAEIRDTEPSIIFLSSFIPAEGVALVNQFLTDPINALVYIQYSPSNPEFRRLLGANSNGVVWQTLIGWLPPPLDQGFVARYEARWGATPAYCAPLNTYDAIYHWALAVEEVGDPTDYDAIVDTIMDTPYTGVCGTYIYDRALQQTIPGNVGEGIPNLFFQIQDEKDHLVIRGTEIVGDFIVPPWITD